MRPPPAVERDAAYDQGHFLWALGRPDPATAARFGQELQLARGMRSHGELMRLAERVALVRSLVVQARTLLPADEAPQRQGEFRPGEHWQRGRVLYRVEPCPLIPSCVRLMPVANAQQPPIHRHRLNTIRFQRICP